MVMVPQQVLQSIVQFAPVVLENFGLQECHLSTVLLLSTVLPLNPVLLLNPVLWSWTSQAS